MKTIINNTNRNAISTNTITTSLETRNLISEVENRVSWFFQDLNTLINNQTTKN